MGKRNRMRPIWMPLYVEKFLADTSGLTLSQKGAYVMLLCAMWRSDDGAISSDDKALCRSASAPRKHWWQIWPNIKHLFDVDGDLITSTHLQAELGKANAIIVTRRAAGAMGGQTTRFKHAFSRQPLKPPKPLKNNNAGAANAPANYNYIVKEKEEGDGSPRPETGSPSLEEKEATSGEVLTSLSAKSSSSENPEPSALDTALQNWGENLRKRHGDGE